MSKLTYKLWIQVEAHVDGEPLGDVDDVLGYLGEVDTLEEAQAIINDVELSFGTGIACAVEDNP